MSKNAKSVKEVLIAARWILANIGWCQNFYSKTKDGRPNLKFSNVKDVGSACISGAVLLVETDHPGINNKALEFIADKIDNWYFESIYSYNLYSVYTKLITDWNDDSMRTKEQVLSFLDRIILEA